MMTRTVRAEALKIIGDSVWRLHYCLRCDHRFPTVQRVPREADYEAADAKLALVA